MASRRARVAMAAGGGRFRVRRAIVAAVRVQRGAGQSGAAEDHDEHGDERRDARRGVHATA